MADVIPVFKHEHQQDAQVQHALRTARSSLRGLLDQNLKLTEEQAEEIRFIVDILAPTAKGKKLTKP